MKYNILIALFVALHFNAAAQSKQQKKTSRFSLTAAAGLNVHTYSKDYYGWYMKLGAEYRIWKGLSAGLRLWHSDYDEFPNRLKTVPFSADDEAIFLQRFIGTSKKEWKAPHYKGFYHFMQGDIMSVSLGYEFLIRKRFFVTPHYGINFMRSKYIVVGLYDAFFVNEILTTGKVHYDVRFGNLTAGSVGFKLGYKLNDRWRLFADLEDIRDLNGTGWINYEAKTWGAGARYSFK